MKKQKIQIAVSGKNSSFSEESTGERMAKIGITMVVLIAVYKLGSLTNLMTVSAPTETAIGLGPVLLIGLAASASSCVAMVGGLLLSVSAAWDQANPNASHWQRLRPQISFNLGRIFGYFVLGGLTGIIGKSLILTVKMTGYTKIFLALVMIWLGLSILGLLPKKYCRFPLPRTLAKRFTELSRSDALFAPFILGGLTYFVPCGFTQSMQLLALGSGDFLRGALIMSVFAIGTLPSLIGISAFSAFADGKVARLFFTVAGSASILLGVAGVRSGLLLADIRILPAFHQASVATSDPNVTIDRNGQQIINVSVTNAGYSTATFTIDKGKSTWIHADALEPLGGCLSTMTVPSFNVSKPLSTGVNWIGPITPERDFTFMCSMGMFRADVRVRT